jgi:hypothetical protein
MTLYRNWHELQTWDVIRETEQLARRNPLNFAIADFMQMRSLDFSNSSVLSLSVVSHGNFLAPAVPGQ